MSATDERAAKKAAKHPSLRHRVEYALYLVLRALARLLGDRGLEAFGAMVAAGAHGLVKRRTQLAMDNLAMVYPHLSESERDRIVRACWRHYATESIRYVRDSGVGFDEISTKFELDGSEHMEHALSSGMGVILISAHFGAWENALSVLGKFGRKVVLVGRVLDNPLLHRRLHEGRTRSGFELLDRRAAARELVRALHDKAIVVLLVDQAVREREGSIVPFLGHDAWTTTSPARLAIKYGCPMLSVFCYPATAQRPEHCEFNPVLRTEGLDEAGVMKLANEEIGRHVEKDPHLWLWFHDRWKGVSRSGATANERS